MSATENYVGFQNKGEIPVNAFKLLGASSKRGDASKIGYFGSGIKYAFAVLLRSDIEFRVFSGLSEIKIGTRQTDFLGQKVKVMTVNGEKTSITIDAGIDWKNWFAIREIYSNALDEGGEIIYDGINPEKGFTKIYISTDTTAFGDLFKNWKRYFSVKRPPLSESAEGRLLEKLPGVPTFHVYRKGILCYEVNDDGIKSVFDYDLNNVAINESRVAKQQYQVYMMSSQVLAMANYEQIMEFLKLAKNPRESDEQYVEWQNEFWYHTGGFNKAWLEAIGDRRVIPANFAGRYEITENHLILPDRLIDRLKANFGKAINTVDDDEKYRIVENSAHRHELLESLQRLEKYGYKVGDDQAFIVNFTDRNILGAVDNRGILIAEKVFKDLLPETELDTIVLEEILHKETGYGDMTRSFQSYLVKSLLISKRKEVNR